MAGYRVRDAESASPCRLGVTERGNHWAGHELPGGESREHALVALGRASPSANPVGNRCMGIKVTTRSAVAVAVLGVPALAGASNGGMYASIPASITSVSCRTACAGMTK